MRHTTFSFLFHSKDCTVGFKDILPEAPLAQRRRACAHGVALRGRAEARGRAPHGAGHMYHVGSRQLFLKLPWGGPGHTQGSSCAIP